jgi:SAM-dependent methyltransferase
MTTIETALRRVYGPLALSLKRRGIRATWSDAVHRKLGTGSPHRASVSDGYDALYGVDTAGSIPLSDLDIRGPNWIFGTAYEATSARRFEELMGFAPEDLASYTFVDFGSGKGKALLLAAAYPFRRVIGVEFSLELNQIARANVRRYKGPRASGEILVVTRDAAHYPLPEGPLVIYLCNPFGAEVMSSVVTNIMQSRSVEPRPISILYYNPRRQRQLLDAGFQLVKHVPDQGPDRPAFSVFEV